MQCKKPEPWEREAKAAAVKAARRRLGRRTISDLYARRQWTASCRLEPEEMHRFIAACEAQGTTRYAAIKAMILAYTDAVDGGD